LLEAWASPKSFRPKDGWLLGAVSVVLGSAQASIIGVGELTYQTLWWVRRRSAISSCSASPRSSTSSACSLIGVVWRVISGRAARAPLGI
jgi:hypothetical protein